MTSFIIEHQCPQCGAPAELEETDRLFQCGYCRVKSYLTIPDYFRYTLPHHAPAGKELIYDLEVLEARPATEEERTLLRPCEGPEEGG